MNGGNPLPVTRGRRFVHIYYLSIVYKRGLAFLEYILAEAATP